MTTTHCSLALSCGLAVNVYCSPKHNFVITESIASCANVMGQKSHSLEHKHHWFFIIIIFFSFLLKVKIYDAYKILRIYTYNFKDTFLSGGDIDSMIFIYLKLMSTERKKNAPIRNPSPFPTQVTISVCSTHEASCTSERREGGSGGTGG